MFYCKCMLWLTWYKRIIHLFTNLFLLEKLIHDFEQVCIEQNSELTIHFYLVCWIGALWHNIFTYLQFIHIAVVHAPRPQLPPVCVSALASFLADETSIPRLLIVKCVRLLVGMAVARWQKSLLDMVHFHSFSLNRREWGDVNECISTSTHLLLSDSVNFSICSTRTGEMPVSEEVMSVSLCNKINVL